MLGIRGSGAAGGNFQGFSEILDDFQSLFELFFASNPHKQDEIGSKDPFLAPDSLSNTRWDSYDSRIYF